METQIHRSRKQENLQENNKNYFPFQAICALGIHLCAGEERRLGDWLLVVVGWGGGSGQTVQNLSVLTQRFHSMCIKMRPLDTSSPGDKGQGTYEINPAMAPVVRIQTGEVCVF